jgi:hypothetical protein
MRALAFVALSHCCSLLAKMDSSATDPVPMISSKLDFNLSRNFFPPKPPGKALPRLSQPQGLIKVGFTIWKRPPWLQNATSPHVEIAAAFHGVVLLSHKFPIL